MATEATKKKRFVLRFQYVQKSNKKREIMQFIECKNTICLKCQLKKE